MRSALVVQVHLHPVRVLDRVVLAGHDVAGEDDEPFLLQVLELVGVHRHRRVRAHPGAPGAAGGGAARPRRWPPARAAPRAATRHGLRPRRRARRAHRRPAPRPPASASIAASSDAPERDAGSAPRCRAEGRPDAPLDAWSPPSATRDSRPVPVHDGAALVDGHRLVRPRALRLGVPAQHASSPAADRRSRPAPRCPAARRPWSPGSGRPRRR